MPTIENLTIYRGEKTDLAFTMDPLEDITNWDISMFIRGASLAFISLESREIVGVIDSGPAGTFHIPLAETDTSDLRPGWYDYDVWRTDTADSHPIAAGRLYIHDVARPL